MTSWPASYNLPPDHCADVLIGSYDVPYNPAAPPVVLDLGANVGAFCRWAVTKWPGCTIHAYEPQPDNYALLCRTVAEMLPGEAIHLYPVAVAKDAGNATLYEGEKNCGEWSLVDQGHGRRRLTVPIIAATELPRADVLKLDVEGAEVEILIALGHRLKGFSAVMLEVHSASTVDAIKVLLIRFGFWPCGETIHAEHRRELRFVKDGFVAKNT